MRTSSVRVSTRPPIAVAGLAEVGDDPAATAAARTCLSPHELAEHGLRHLLDAPRAAALGARRRRRARGRAAPATRRAGRRDAQRHLQGRSPRCIEEVDLHLGEHVAASAPRARRPTEEVVAEERREEVGEAAEVEVRGPESAASQAVVPVPIVQLSRLRPSKAPRTPRRSPGSARRRSRLPRRRDEARGRARGTPS